MSFDEKSKVEISFEMSDLNPKNPSTAEGWMGLDCLDRAIEAVNEAKKESLDADIEAIEKAYDLFEDDAELKLGED